MTAPTVESTEVPETEETSTNPNPWIMAGTEGTNEYLVLASSSFGRVGYRLLPYGKVRIRVEPASLRHADKFAEILTHATGWKQPGEGHQNRFSTVLNRGIQAIDVLEEVFALIKRGRPIEYNPTPPRYKDDLKAPAASESGPDLVVVFGSTGLVDLLFADVFDLFDNDGTDDSEPA